MLRLFAHEPALLRRAQGRIPEPVVEILVRGQLPWSAPEGDDFTQDGGHPPASRDCSLQISRMSTFGMPFSVSKRPASAAILVLMDWPPCPRTWCAGQMPRRFSHRPACR